MKNLIVPEGLKFHFVVYNIHCYDYFYYKEQTNQYNINWNSYDEFIYPYVIYDIKFQFYDQKS